jgi:hypothetical protein
MHCAFGLPSPLQEQFSREARWSRPGGFSEANGLIRQPFFKALLMLDAPTLLHTGLRSVGGRREHDVASSSPTDAIEGAVMF